MNLRHFIALSLLQLLFPQGMRGARAAVVLPLPASATPATEHPDLVALLRTPQIVVDPAHPSTLGLDLLASLGSQSVRIPLPYSENTEVLPELARQCDTLLGIDVHPHAAAVAAALRRVGVDADLRQGSVESLPLPDASVDVAVVVSALEFVDDIHAAARELARVLRPGGALVVVTPGQGRLLDLGLTVLTGENPEDTFQGRRGTILPALRAVLREEAVTTFPPRWLPLMPRLYTCSLLRKG